MVTSTAHVRFRMTRVTRLARYVTVNRAIVTATKSLKECSLKPKWGSARPNRKAVIAVAASPTMTGARAM